MSPVRDGLVALVAGAVLVAAFAPFGLFPLAFLAPAVLFHYWSRATPGQSAWLGYLFGLGLFGAGASWVYVSIHEFGNMPAPMAALAVVLFVAYLALFPALAGWLQARLAGTPTQRLLGLIPPLWLLAEWLRGWLLTGFPWLHLGYSQSDGALMGLAPLLGIYGMSLATVVVAVLLAMLYRSRGVARLYVVAGLTLLLLGSALAGRIEFTRPLAGSVEVALIQGNIPLTQKWAPGAGDAILAHYIALGHEAAGRSDLVVWPEGAIPDDWQAVAGPLSARLAGHRATYLAGVIDRPQPSTYYNAAAVLNGDGGLYRKRHLVPFGEFLPLEGLLGWLIDYLHIPMSDFRPWPVEQAPLRLAGHPVAVSICYEDAFGEELIGPAGDAAYLVNLSEDAWFGDSLAPAQRLQMARVRARENGRTFLRAANTGITAVIDADGRVAERLPQFRPGVLYATVTPRSGTTLYARVGNALVIGLATIWLILAVRIARPVSPLRR